MKKNNRNIVGWLSKKCIDQNGNINISGLDFGEFKGNLLMGGMKLEGNILQDRQQNKGQVIN